MRLATESKRSRVRCATLRDAGGGIALQRAERGIATAMVLAAVLIITVVGLALIDLMDGTFTRASVQPGVARSLSIAQAGLEEANARVAAAPDPAAYATPARGVTAGDSNGRFTYWVDAGPAGGCGSGLKTLEVQGEVGPLGRTIWSRVRACTLGGTPFLAALFGVGRVQFEGAASRVYLAPYQVGVPGGGGSVGSFTEVSFADKDVRVNALSEAGFDALALRDGSFRDYGMYGLNTPPDPFPNPAAGAAPRLLSAFGDIIKAQPSTGALPNRCQTEHACLTVANVVSDIRDIAGLRAANDVHHVYFNHVQEEQLPPLALDPDTFKAQAAHNTANADLNGIVGLAGKVDSLYERAQFYQLMVYLADHPGQFLRGPVFIDGTVELLRDWNLGGNSGNVTLAVAGDLIIGKALTLTNRHDLSTAAGRRLPGIVLFSSPAPAPVPTEVCGGEFVGGSGRLVVCEESRLTVDGLIYTQDGMVIEPRASVDQIGAMYHDNHGTLNPSFTLKNGVVTLRFDPLAMSIFGRGATVVSWQQLNGPDVAGTPPVSPPASAFRPPAAATATPPGSPEPSATGVPSPAAARPASTPPAAPPVPPTAVVPSHTESRPASTPQPVYPQPPAAVVPPRSASRPISAPLPVHPEPPAAVVPPRSASRPVLATPPAAAPSSPMLVPQHPDPRTVSGRAPAAPPSGTPAAAHPAPPTVQAGSGGVHIQAGAFRNREYALDLVRRLRARGYPATLVEGPLTLVWVGPQTSREAAERFAGNLRADGFEVILSAAR